MCYNDAILEDLWHSRLRNKRPGLSGRPPCKGIAIGVVRRGARLGGAFIMMPLYLSIPKCWSLNFGVFAVDAPGGGEKKDKGPQAMYLNRRDLDCHPILRHPIFVFAITPNFYFFITETYV